MNKKLIDSALMNWFKNKLTQELETRLVEFQDNNLPETDRPHADKICQTLIEKGLDTCCWPGIFTSEHIQEFYWEFSDEITQMVVRYPLDFTAFMRSTKQGCALTGMVYFAIRECAILTKEGKN